MGKGKKNYRRNRRTKRKNLKSVIRSVLYKQSETKYFYANANGSVSNAGIYYNICAIPQNVTSEGRLGADVRLLWCNMNVHAKMNSTTPVECGLRVLMYVYKSKSTAGVPVVGLPFHAALGSYPNSLLSNYDNKTVGDECYIIYDRYFTIHDNNPICLFSTGKLSLKNILCQLDSSGYGTNQVYVCMLTDIGTNIPYYINTRVAYKDI